MKRTTRRATIAAAAVAAVLCPGRLGAQDFSGSIETRLGWYWSSSELAGGAVAAEGRVDGKVGPEDAPSAQYSARVKAEFDPSAAAGAGAAAAAAAAATRLSLGEAWIKLFAGPFDLSFGNQVVAWSPSDAFTPSDLVNPVDMSLPVDPVKTPVPLARVLWNAGPLTLDLVAQPFWVAAAPPAARWLPADPLEGFTLDVADDRPVLDWDNVAYGGRVEARVGLLQGLDLGATFYRGRLSTPRAEVAITGPGEADVTLEYDRATAVGADLVLAPGGGLLIKTEWVYTALRDTSLLEPEAGAASLEGVSGLECSIGALRIIAEYVFDWAKGSAPAGDGERHAAVLILSGDAGSRLSLKLAGVCDFSGGGSGMAAPQLGYAIADGLSVSLNAYAFFGASGTRYGDWKENAMGRIALKYSF